MATQLATRFLSIARGSSTRCKFAILPQIDAVSSLAPIVQTYTYNGKRYFSGVSSSSSSPADLEKKQHGKQRVIGILGGMSWASTALYYRDLNNLCRERLGGLHSCELLLRSVDFAVVEQLQASNDWEQAGVLLANAAIQLQAGGADFLVLATNTMHKVAPAIVAATSIPFLHIADATANAIVGQSLQRPGLMATAYTMEQDFYVERLRAAGLEVVIPGAADRKSCHDIIFQELCKDVVRESSRQEFERIAARLVERGADSLILGCTEVGLLLSKHSVSVPVFDTTKIHCEAAVQEAFRF
eukprot:TRINITY_DN106094_c0_g1_i1.p1 TRINITY_DN106094_c0_g1~~TRINITY_DN106094_c0_g1_i1.p1  ORF type:complete len:300 (-),score=50.27 TRINITY_DN106094_c0_g1_i1:57-956(-)